MILDGGATKLVVSDVNMLTKSEVIPNMDIDLRITIFITVTRQGSKVISTEGAPFTLIYYGPPLRITLILCSSVDWKEATITIPDKCPGLNYRTAEIGCLASSRKCNQTVGLSGKCKLQRKLFYELSTCDEFKKR